MSRLRLDLGRAGTLAIIALAVAWGVQMHSMGWAQSANFAQVRALADGQAEIDPWHWETKDKAWVDGHFYSVKAPGLALLTTPLFIGLDGVGGTTLAAQAADNAASSDNPKWISAAGPPYSEFGYDAERAAVVERQVIDSAPMIWALTLLGAVLPAAVLLLLVRWVADRVAPGYGTAAAITLGLGTIVMTFASEFFPHVIGATLGFAAFALLLRERDGEPRPAMALGAGLLAGIAVSFEYQLFLVGVILFFLVISGHRRVARGGAFAAGAVVGALPALAFNWWALGSPLKFAYGDAVSEQGFTGHDELGLNDDGLFGVMLPDIDSAFDLLFDSRGLLVLTPVVVMCFVGVLLMRTRGSGFKAESNVILAVAAAYFIYNAGYWLPFGGGTPGPRFLIPALPFIAVGLAPAFRRLPAMTLTLAIPSAVTMVVAALTFPLIGEQSGGMWMQRLMDANLEHTLLTVLGVDSNGFAAIPVLVAIGAGIGLAVKATPRTPLDSIGTAFAVLGAWVVVAVLGPVLAGSATTAFEGQTGTPVLGLFALAAVLAALVLAGLAAQRSRASAPAPADDWVGDPASSGSIS